MKTSLLVAALAAGLSLTACGNKGPLVLPDKPPADRGAPAAPAAPAAKPAIDETPSPLPPSSPPPASDPTINNAGNATNGG